MRVGGKLDRPVGRAWTLLIRARTLLFAALLALALAVAGTPAAVPAAAVTEVSVDDSVVAGTNRFTYTGSSWTVCGGCNAGAFQGGFRYAFVTGDQAVFSFSGTQAAFYAYRERPGGIAGVSVDGDASRDVDFYAASQSLVEVFRTPVLPSGPHTVSFTVTGRKSAGTSATINIDRAVVTSGPAPTSTTTTTPTPTPTSTTPTATPTLVNVDDSVVAGTNRFTYTGSSWTVCGGCNAGAFQGGFRYAFVTGDQAVFSFSGTQAAFYAYRERPGGIAGVSVDGDASRDVDFYAASQSLVEVFRTPVLPSGPHTVSFTVTGRKSAGTSATINIDRAVVTSGPAPTSTTTTTPTPTDTHKHNADGNPDTHGAAGGRRPGQPDLRRRSHQPVRQRVPSIAGHAISRERSSSSQTRLAGGRRTSRPRKPRNS